MLDGDCTKWAVGLALALLSCFLSSLGLTLQRLSNLREEKDARLFVEAADAGKTSCRPLWVLGVGLYVLASAPDVLSYLLVPQVVCSAVSCFRLVVVSVMAWTVLGERLSIQQTCGMCACTVGTFMCLCFGPVRMGKEAMTQSFGQPVVKIYLAAAGAILFCLFVFDHLDSISTKCKLSTRCHSFTLPFMAGLSFAISKVFNTMIAFFPAPHVSSVLLHPEWIGMASSVAILGFVDLYMTLRATRLMAVQVFVPVAFVWHVSLQYFQSVALFSEFHGLETGKAALSIIGACLSLVGALCIQLPTLSRSAATQTSSNLTENVMDCEMQEKNVEARWRAYVSIFGGA